MSTICLKVEAFAGTGIEDACRDLCALADRVGILCEVGFNGVKLWAYPGADPAQLAKAWAVQMERPAHVYKIASARPCGVQASAAPSDRDLHEMATAAGLQVSDCSRALRQLFELARAWPPGVRTSAAPASGPLRDLGAYLARVLDEDQWAHAEALLLKATDGVALPDGAQQHE